MGSLDEDIQKLEFFNRGSAVIRIIYLATMPYGIYIGAWWGVLGLVLSFLFLHKVAAETRRTIQILYEFKEKRDQNAIRD